MDCIRYLTIGTISDAKDLIDTHEQILSYILNQDYNGACNLIIKYAFEITKTYKHIISQHEEWFLEDKTDQ